MENFLDILNKNVLFKDIEPSQMESLLKCLEPTRKNFEKKAYLINEGDTVASLGIVLSGNLHIIKEDYWGNRSILTKVSPGELFAETYACLKHQPSEVAVLANSPCDILFLDINKVLTLCSNSCEFHSKLIQNLLMVLARKNLMLTRKMAYTSKRTTREKLLSYLSAQAISSSSNSFEIPYNRQDLADYLSVDRSAMSNELSKLANEGIIEYKKNKFKLFSYDD